MGIFRYIKGKNFRYTCILLELGFNLIFKQKKNRFLQGKDFFQALYKRDLSKRLLLEVKSRNAEKSMLSKLRKGNNNNLYLLYIHSFHSYLI